MASVDQPFQPQDEEQQSAPAPGQQQLTSGSGSVGGGAGSMAPASQAPTSSGAYPNLSKYMQANADWNSGQGGLGGEIAQNLNQQGNQVQQQVQQTNNAFQNQGTLWQQNLNQANNTFQQGLADPNAFLQNNPNAQQYANTAMNAQYTGAQDLNASNPNLNQQVQNYATTAQQGQTEPGRYNLLRQMFGNPNYTQGQQSLDQVFLQNSPGQLQQLQGAQQQASQAQLGFQNANQAAQQSAQDWQNFANQTQNQSRNAFNSSIGNTAQTIQNEFQTAKTQQQQDMTNLQNALSSGTITQAEANELGINSLGGQNIYNVNLGQYLTPAQLTAQNTATSADYSRINALAQLAGNPSVLTAPSAQTLAQYQSQPSTLYNSANDVGINTNQAQGAIQNAAQAYQDALNAPISWGGMNAVNTINTYLPFANLMNQNAQGGQVMVNPETLQGATYAQMGLSPSQDYVPRNDPRDSGMLTNAELQYYGNQGYQTGTVYTPDQQAQIGALQQQISGLSSAPNASNNSFQIKNLQDQLNQVQSQGKQTITDPKFYQNASPLDFYKALLNGQTSVNANDVYNNYGWAPGVPLFLDALGSLMNTDKTYDPTRTLQITPEPSKT